MKYLKERKLAQKVLKEELGFAPTLENIIPLESSHRNGICTYVLFEIKNSKRSIQYRATIGGELIINEE